MAYSHLGLDGAERIPGCKISVNSEKTIFMKRQGSDFIIHGLSVDDMMHVPTCDKLRDEFLQLYQKDFEITGGGLMETFLGMEIEQPGKVIRMHLDTYVQSVLDEYKEYIKKALRPKRVPMSPGVVLDNEDCPDVPDPRKQKYYLSFIAKLQFAASWVRFDILILCHRLHDFVLPQVRRTGLHSTT